MDQILALVERAAELRAKDMVHRQWCALYPQMVLGLVNFVSFEDYYNRVTGGSLDLRPAEEILAEAEQIRKEFGIDGTV